MILISIHSLPKVSTFLNKIKYSMMKNLILSYIQQLINLTNLNNILVVTVLVRNWILDQKVKTYKQIGKSISRFDLNELIQNLKK